MRTLRRYIEEAADYVKAGRSLKALEPLAQATELMRLLGLDAVKARGGRTGG